MTVAHQTLRRPTGLALLLPLLLLLSGCSKQGSMAAPVDEDQAHTTLVETLDAWKAGRLPADLRSASPEIIAQDPDWENGMKLQEYEAVGKGEKRDANLESQNTLTRVDPQGTIVTKSVTYIVGTDPVLTVFRKVNM